MRPRVDSGSAVDGSLAGAAAGFPIALVLVGAALSTDAAAAVDDVAGRGRLGVSDRAAAGEALACGRAGGALHATASNATRLLFIEARAY
jgi:hypothetical protein